MPRFLKKSLLILIAFSLFTTPLQAARGRKICSGKKGGFSHCDSSGKHVCKDGSVSKSKKKCQ